MDCEANSDVSIDANFNWTFWIWALPSLSLYFQLAVRFCVCPQDLLCYLVDDGGFLIMSNQKDDWNKVLLKNNSFFRWS